MSGPILIVDDDDALAENLAEIVSGLGVQVTVAREQKTALAAAMKTDFDVAIIDVRLPDGDGLALLESLQRQSPLIQSVLVTGDATLEGAIAAVRGGAFAYVLKPFSPQDLLDTVRRASERAVLYRERERLRRELEISEQTHRQLVESVPSFVLATNERGLITTWNRQLERVTGFQRREVLGTPAAKVLGEGEGPHELPLKTGGVRKVRWRRSNVPSKDGVTTYAVGIDVTDEQEMLRRTMRAERLAAVGTMAAGLAHEVRNPLNSANLQLTLLERRIERGDSAETTLPIARIVKGEIERLDRLVRDFLAFAQPRPFEPKAVDVEELITGIANLVRPEAEAAQVQVGVEVPPRTPPVQGDPERLRQVLLNLTRNAIEAMQERGGTLILRAHARADSGRDPTVDIEVEDNGPGFKEENPVFDAFFTTKPHGTGLGLSIVHRIVSDHGGTIRARSKPGSTCFSINLPAQPNDADAS
jgi:PAS domain S-box-containing protein